MLLWAFRYASHVMYGGCKTLQECPKQLLIPSCLSTNVLRHCQLSASYIPEYKRQTHNQALTHSGGPCRSSCRVLAGNLGHRWRARYRWRSLRAAAPAWALAWRASGARGCWGTAKTTATAQPACCASPCR